MSTIGVRPIDEGSTCIREFLNSGTAPEQIAVIAAWGQDRDRVADVLREAGVPVFAREDGAWRATQVTSLIEATAAWISQGDASGRGLPDLLTRFATVLRASANSHRVLADIVTAIRECIGTESGSSLIERILAAGLKGVMTSSRGEDNLELEAMRGWLSANPEFTIADLGTLARSPGRVMATTIHSAKGLEFDAVVIVGVDSAAIDGFSQAESDVPKPDGSSTSLSRAHAATFA